MTTPIVAFSGAPGAGKSTAAKYLVREHGFTYHGISSTLKNMMRCLGLEEDHITGALKEIPSPLLGGCSPRWAMQTLGKDWRDLVHPDLWLIAWENTRPSASLVLDDFRFPNEIPFLRERGALLIRIVRHGFHLEDTGHEAERQVLETDLTIHNEGSLEQFERRLYRILKEHRVLA